MCSAKNETVVHIAQKLNIMVSSVVLASTAVQAIAYRQRLDTDLTNIGAMND